MKRIIVLITFFYSININANPNIYQLSSNSVYSSSIYPIQSSVGLSSSSLGISGSPFISSSSPFINSLNLGLKILQIPFSIFKSIPVVLDLDVVDDDEIIDGY